MNRFHPVLLVALVLMVGACDAQDEIISANLFDDSASGPATLTDNTNIRNGTFILNTNMIMFYDTGGSSSQYRNNENIVMTILPPDATFRVAFDLIDFVSQYTGSGGDCTSSDDYLYIYDGTSVNAPRLGQWCGVYNNFFHPFQYVALNSDGALTFQWRSNSQVTFDGFVATLSLLSSSQSYSVTGLRTISFGSSQIRAIYRTAGPFTLMSNHGVCYSNTLTVPSRTNGATCSTASINRYGTISWVLGNNVTAFSTFYVRAFLTQPSGSIIYSSVSTVIPITKAMPDFTGHSGAPHQDEIIGSDF